MFMKKMSKRERTIAVAAVSIVAAAILYNFVFDPVLRQWQALNIEVESKTSVLKHDVSILTAQKTLETNYAKFSKYVRSDKSEEESVAETLAYLEKLAREDSCFIANMKPIGTKDLGSCKELLIDLSAEGNAEQFNKFLYDIENAKNIILKVRHFTLTSKAGQEGSLKGTFLISKVIIE
jgi:hypothetical protein